VTGVRGTLAYKGGSVKAYLQAEYVYVNQTSAAQFGVPITPATPGVVSFPTITGGVDYLPVNSVFGLPKMAFPLPDRGSFESRQLHLRGQLDFALTDRLNLTYTGGYLDSNSQDFSPLAGSLLTPRFTSVDPMVASKDWSNELRLSYRGKNGLFLQAGGFYFHEKQASEISTQILQPSLTVFPFLPPGTTALYANYLYRPSITTRSIAAFAQGDFPLTDTLIVTGGIRYSNDKKHGIYYNAGFGLVNPGFGLGIPSMNDILTQSGGQLPSRCSGVSGPPGSGYSVLDNCYGPKGQVSWLANIKWTPVPGHMLYAKVSTGYRSGGFDNLTSQVINGRQFGKFDPETITAYEVGSKNRFFDNRLEFNLTGFYYDYTNMQIDSFISSAIGFATVNAGKARFYGVEADVNARLGARDNIKLNVNYLDAKFTSYEIFSTGVNGGTINRDLSGNRPANAPKWTIAFGYDHEFDLGDKGTLTASVFSRYKSQYNLTSLNYAGDLQKGYVQTDLSVSYSPAGKKFSLQAYVRNIENYVPIVFASFTGGPPINVYNYVFGQPRTFGVMATIRY
jgi:iron complex outermembrane receptor protein